MQKLLKIAQKIAEKDHDGHLTFLKFTTGWKAMFGTPNPGSGEGREEVMGLPQYGTLEDALYHLILDSVEES